MPTSEYSLIKVPHIAYSLQTIHYSASQRLEELKAADLSAHWKFSPPLLGRSRTGLVFKFMNKNPTYMFYNW